MSVVDDLFSVRDKVALVTGGASGLGYAFAEILAVAGATVVIADWDAGALQKAVVSLEKTAIAAGRGPAAGAARAAARQRPQRRRQRREGGP